MRAGAVVLQFPRRPAGATPAGLPAVVFRPPRPPSADPRRRKPGSLARRAWHFSRASVKGRAVNDDTTGVPLPDWGLWRHFELVTLRDAVALSLNIDPDFIRPQPPVRRMLNRGIDDPRVSAPISS